MSVAFSVTRRLSRRDGDAELLDLVDLLGERRIDDDAVADHESLPVRTTPEGSSESL